MKVSLDEREMQDCKECGEELNSQTMSIHYKIHYDSLQKNMSKNKLLILLSLRAQKENEHNERHLAAAKKTKLVAVVKKTKLVALLTLRAKIVKENNERCLAAIVHKLK